MGFGMVTELLIVANIIVVIFR